VKPGKRRKAARAVQFAGFDPKACAAIRAVLAVLPTEAEREAAFAGVEWAALDYHRPGQPRRRLEHLRTLINRLKAELKRTRYYPSLGDAIRRALGVLGVLDGETETLLQQRRSLTPRELLYGQLLCIWREAGGSFGVSRGTKTGGPCASYMITTVHVITGTLLTPVAVKKIVKRWYPNRER
jgi:hypothetical protein